MHVFKFSHNCYRFFVLKTSRNLGHNQPCVTHATGLTGFDTSRVFDALLGAPARPLTLHDSLLALQDVHITNYKEDVWHTTGYSGIIHSGT